MKKFFLTALIFLSFAPSALAQDALAASRSSPKHGYLLITVQSNMSGVLPIKSASFWSRPRFAALAPRKHYLFKLKPGSYSFGGLTVGMRVGWGTFDEAQFSIKQGHVTYVGEHTFIGNAGPTHFSWSAMDSLDNVLKELQPTELAQIAGWPVDHQVPVIELAEPAP